jgi:hypothetical protein
VSPKDSESLGGCHTPRFNPSLPQQFWELQEACLMDAPGLGRTLSPKLKLESSGGCHKLPPSLHRQNSDNAYSCLVAVFEDTVDQKQALDNYKQADPWTDHQLPRLRSQGMWLNGQPALEAAHHLQ